MAGYRAILFDMDGVLVDSEPLFLSAINRLLVEEGVDMFKICISKYNMKCHVKMFASWGTTLYIYKQPSGCSIKEPSQSHISQ